MTSSLFCTLSEDILLKILSFMSLKELMTASEVCKTWRRVSKDSSLWSVLDLRPYRHGIKDDTLLSILSDHFAPLGRKLSLGGFIVKTEMLQILFQNCRHLHTLHLKGCKLQSTGDPGDINADFSSLKMVDLRQSRGYSLEIEDVLERAVNLECLGLYPCFPCRMYQSVFINKPRLRILECKHCDWISDHHVKTIAYNCPKLEYFSLYRCYNFGGKSLKRLLESCRNLQTLILTGTRIDDNSLTSANWECSRITSLDILHCTCISDFGVSAVLAQLPRLRYLRCALTDENYRLLQQRGFPQVETLQIHRRYPITINFASKLLIGCPLITWLDISSIPFSHVHFHAFLPSMPLLKWICLAANECCGTNSIFKALATHSPKLEAIWIVYYHCNERDSIKDAFVELAMRCSSLKVINLTGLYVNDVLQELEFTVKNAGIPRNLEFNQNETFVVRQPDLNLDHFMEF